MAQQILGTNTFTTAKWIVSATASDGTHTTIATALTSASSGDTIFIRPGTYTENITLKAGVNLVSFNGDSNTPNVTIVGKATFTAAGTVSISNIRLQTNSDNLLAVTGSAASIVNLNNCFLNCSNNTGISFTTSSPSAVITLNNCYGDIGTTGIGLFASTSAGILNINYSMFSNTGGSSTANTISAGNLIVNYSNILNPITSSSTASVSMQDALISTSAQNVTAFTNGGSGNAGIVNTTFSSGSASAISTSTTLNISGCQISSSNTNAITGAGTIFYQGLTFASSKIINTTTQTGGILIGSQNTTPPAGFLGEVITANASSVSMTSTNAKTIASITLTAGVWDVSGMGTSIATGGTGTMTLFIIGISATNNTVTGTTGIDYYQVNTAASPQLGGTTAPVRVTVSTNTTYYVVVNTIFSSTTCPTNGIIRAVRVG